MMIRLRPQPLLVLALALTMVAIAIADSPNPRVWALLNTAQDRVMRWIWAREGTTPPTTGEGTLRGFVRDEAGEPIVGAWVLLSAWDGTTFADRSDAQGGYLIQQIPRGRYRVMAQAPGYRAASLGARWGGVELQNGFTTELMATLYPERPREPVGYTQAEVGEPTTLRCERPLPREATRRPVHTALPDGPTSATYLYLPTGMEAAERAAVLIALYPGPVESYECVSVALAASGYAVLALGPAYNLDVEQTVDELEALAGLARSGVLPHTDGSRLAALGGSYSAILINRLAQRQPSWLDAQVLLGPPTDLFEARRRFEAGSYVPPFGLDELLIALGLPDRRPELYWRYSGRFHLSAQTPPTLLFHSRHDEIVPYQQSEQMAADLAELGVPHEVTLFDGGTHYLLEEGEVVAQMYDQTLRFLAQRLDGDE